MATGLSSKMAGLHVTGSKVNVPDNYRAHLMYYLKIVTACIDIDDVDDRLLDQLRNLSLNLWICVWSTHHVVWKTKCSLTTWPCAKTVTIIFMPTTKEKGSMRLRRYNYMMINIPWKRSIMAYKKVWIQRYWETPMKFAMERFTGHCQPPRL